MPKLEKKWSEVAQSCLTLSDPMDCSLPGSSVHGIFQARVLEWGAIAFSNLRLSRQQLYCNVLELLMLGFAKRRLMTQKRPWCCTMKTFIFSSESTQKVILLTQRSLKCSLVGWLQQRNRWTMVELMRLQWHQSLQLRGTSNTSRRTVISSLGHTWRR